MPAYPVGGGGSSGRFPPHSSRQKSSRILAYVATDSYFSVGVASYAYGLGALVQCACGWSFGGVAVRLFLSVQCPPSPIGGGGSSGQFSWEVCFTTVSSRWSAADDRRRLSSGDCG